MTDSSRREFIGWGAAMAAFGTRPATAHQEEQTSEQTPVAEPGHDVTAKTIEEAEKLNGLELTPDERRQIVDTIEEQLVLIRRRVEETELPNALAPATVFDPRLPGFVAPEQENRVSLSTKVTNDPPADDKDIAFASVRQLGHWLHRGAVTSVQLTELSIRRLKRYGPRLECVITLMEQSALQQARRADQELAEGRSRGPLHGIPWGAKDLLDTAGVSTTWGATPYRGRVPDDDAFVVKRLEESGAVLVAKLTLGALAYGDIWFDGKTRNPFDPEQGSSGSSAGPASATAAGLVGFALGTETYGSIVSPCMRCGTTGLRPTFGRVGRTGAMALCWSLDKIGPICRTVEGCGLVLQAINGPDPGDASSIDVPFGFDACKSPEGVRVGYDPSWFEGDGASDADRKVLELLPQVGCRLQQVSLPKWPYDSLLTILFAEAAAAFEEITRNGQDDQLVWQEPEAWPNTFRRTWFLSAVELVQTERFRRAVMEMMAAVYTDVDVLVSPSFAASLLLITNNTGHPSLTLRTGFRDNGTPRGTTLWGRLFEEGTLCNVGMALEQALGVWNKRPNL